MNLKNKKVFLTGGTGSFGKAFVSELVNEHEFSNLVIFSRDELKQFEMAESINDPRVTFILGDIRDAQKVSDASVGMDIIVHAAAMKQIVASEKNPLEAIKTNVFGATNIISAAVHNKVERVIALSTDKAANPINLYGATKLCSDKLMISANYLPGNSSTRFSVVRYGNVLGSRGSVIPFFKSKALSGEIPITDDRMTRFWITLEQAVSFVLSSLDMMVGGEIFVPRIPSFKVVDVAKIVAPNTPTKIIGIRPGEKLHELMITEDDAVNTFKMKDRFVITSPELKSTGVYQKISHEVPNNFSYSSESNDLWFTDETFMHILQNAKLL
jgi:UDP-N-acetylglucosamine 4,6-dehydratase